MIPTTADIRNLLEDYGLDLSGTASLTGNTAIGSPIITAIDTRALEELQTINGAGIPAGSFIASIDTVAPSGQITMSANALATATGVALSAVSFPVVSNRWLTNERDRFVIPWVEEKCRKSFSEIKTVTEYYSGTGSSLLILKNRPIVSLLVLGYTNVDTNFYYLSPYAVQTIAEEGILKAKANFNESSYIPIFYKGDRNIKVTYSYGYASMPDDVSHAVSCFVAERALGHIGSKTGGGDLSGEKYSRGFGSRGKWTHERNDLARAGIALIRKYMTGIVST
jgi:hypothetical protein